MREKANPRSLPDDELLRGFTESVRQSRRVEADIVAQIAEVDARRLYAREGTPSGDRELLSATNLGLLPATPVRGSAGPSRRWRASG